MQGRSLMIYRAQKFIFQQMMRHTKCRCKSVSGMGKGNNQAEQVFDATKSIVED